MKAIQERDARIEHLKLKRGSTVKGRERQEEETMMEREL